MFLQFQICFLICELTSACKLLGLAFFTPRYLDIALSALCLCLPIIDISAASIFSRTSKYTCEVVNFLHSSPLFLIYYYNNNNNNNNNINHKCPGCGLAPHLRCLSQLAGRLAEHLCCQVKYKGARVNIWYVTTNVNDLP